MALLAACYGLAFLLLGEAARIDVNLSDSSHDLEGGRRKMGMGSKLVIWADYDGCFDIISPTNTFAQKIYAGQAKNMKKERNRVEPFKTLEEVQQMLRGKLKEMAAGYDEVTLFIGSNRQSEELENYNEKENQNGKSMTGLAQLVGELGAEMDNTPPWKFNNAILETEGGHWNEAKVREIFNRGSAPLKRRMAQHLWRHVSKSVAKTGVDVVFFDDNAEYLVAVAKEKIPQGMNLYLVHFDNFGIAFEGGRWALSGPYNEEKREAKQGWVEVKDFA